MFEEELKINNKEGEMRKNLIDHMKNVGLEFLNAHLMPYRENPKLFIDNLTPEDIETFIKYTELCRYYHPENDYEIKKAKRELPDLENKIKDTIQKLDEEIKKNENEDKIMQTINKEAAELKKQYPTIWKLKEYDKHPEFEEKFNNIYVKARKRREEVKYNSAACRRNFYIYIEDLLRSLVTKIQSLKGSPISEK